MNCDDVDDDGYEQIFTQSRFNFTADHASHVHGAVFSLSIHHKAHFADQSSMQEARPESTTERVALSANAMHY